MRIFIKRYGYDISNTTMHKYMNKELRLCAVIMHSKIGCKAGKKHKIFDNLLNQNFTVDCKFCIRIREYNLLLGSLLISAKITM